MAFNDKKALMVLGYADDLCAMLLKTVMLLLPLLLVSLWFLELVLSQNQGQFLRVRNIFRMRPFRDHRQHLFPVFPCINP